LDIRPGCRKEIVHNHYVVRDLGRRGVVSA